MKKTFHLIYREILRFQYLILLLLAIPFFFIVIQSPLIGDDIINASVLGFVHNGDFGSLFSLSSFYGYLWCKNGRPFWLSFMYMYFLHTICTAIWYTVAYKCFLVLLSIANILLSAFTVNKLLPGKQAGFLCGLLFLAVTPLHFFFDNPFINYHGMMQFLVMFFLLSVLFLGMCLKAKKTFSFRLYGFFSVFFHFLAISLYEPAYCLIVFLLIPVFFSRLPSRKKAALCAGYLIPWIFFVGYNIFFQIFGNQYAGIKISFTFSAFLNGFFSQLSSYVPLFSAFYFNVLTWKSIQENLSFSGITLAVLLLLCLLLATHKKFYWKRCLFWYFLLLAFALLFVPCFLMGISAYYSRHLTTGFGWLPGYMTTFGFCFLFFFIFLLLCRYQKNKIVLVIRILLCLCCSITFFLTYASSRISLKKRIAIYSYARESCFLASKMFSDVKKDRALFLIPERNFPLFQLDKVTMSVFFSALLHKHIGVISAPPPSTNNMFYLNFDVDGDTRYLTFWKFNYREWKPRVCKISGDGSFLSFEEPLTPPDKIYFSKNTPFCINIQGFRGPGPTGLWTEGATAEILVAAPREFQKYDKIRLKWTSIWLSADKKQQIEIFVNNVPVRSVHLSTPQDQEIVFPIPEGCGNVLKFTFLIKYPTSPHDLGVNGDVRKFGFTLDSLVFEKAQPGRSEKGSPSHKEER